MKIIPVDNGGLTFYVPDCKINAYRVDPADPNKTIVIHVANGTQVYNSTFAGTPAELTTILTS